MAARAGLFEYIAAAFSARPLGMFVAPNWVALAAAGMLGLVNPGFWVIGAGLELGYLLLLSTNGRFQRLVDARRQSGADTEWDTRIHKALERLSERDRRRHGAFADRCRSILELQHPTGSTFDEGMQAQTESLGRLSWAYLRLLVTQDVITDVLGETGDSEEAELAARHADLRRQLERPNVDPELRRSLEAQAGILGQRLERRAEAQRKLPFIQAELTRIEQQVELIREQAALSADPERLSQQIDDITATLGGTAQWIRDQQQLHGAMEDLLAEPPPVTIDRRVRERQ